MPSSKQSKKSQKPPSKQPPTEQSMQGTSKGKQPMQPPPKQPVQANPTGKKAAVQQAPTEQSTQGTSKDKQPMHSPSEQPIQANSTGKKSQQLPLGQPMGANPKARQPHPEQPMQTDAKGKQPQKPPAHQSVQDDSKGDQPTLEPVSGFPSGWIARIPVKRTARIKRVRVFLIPDTAYRDPQTFFFKNIPKVDRFWGELNDAATTAQRIVRMERDGHPTPYFLLVCRGEYPEVRSPRNKNAIFADMHVPVFGDAFVFKLADPETTENGYVRYDHIEEGIGGSDWIPEAIRDAARKVEYATASNANPGFPDIKHYADQETMSKDAHRMLRRVNAYLKADKKDLPHPDMVKGVIEKLTMQLHDWIKHVSSTADGDPETSDPNTSQDPIHQAIDAFIVIGESINGVNAAHNVDETLSASTIHGSPNAETADGVGRFVHPLTAMKDAFIEYIARLKAITALQQGGSHELDFTIAQHKLNDAFQALKAEVVKHEIFTQVKVAKVLDAARKVDAVRTSEVNNGTPDLPETSGTKRYRVERLN